MRKFMIIVGLFASTMLLSANAAHNNIINVTINGQVVNFTDQAPVIIDGRTFVPIRDVFETLGWEVAWLHETSTVLLRSENFGMRIGIGSDGFSLIRHDLEPNEPGFGHYAINLLDTPAQIINGRTMLPLRAILESVGYEVVWDEVINTVLITYS